MNTSEEIAALQAQRNALNKRIRELKDDGLIEVPRARIARVHSYAYRQNEQYNVAYACPLQTYRVKPSTQYRTLFSGSRTECIEAIPGIIGDLQALYEAAKEAKE